MNAGTRRSTLVLLAVLCAPASALAQQVTATTLPLKDKDAYAWLFFDDIVLGIDYGGKVTKDARINAYSFTQRKLLWRQQDIEASHFTYEETFPHSPDYTDKVLYVGNGPFAAVDVTTGMVRWKKDCDEAGFITRDITQAFGATKLIVAGSDKCKWRGGASDGSLLKNLEQEKKLMLLNRATGQVIWTHRAKARTKTKHGWGSCGLFGCTGPYSLSQSFAVIGLARGGDGRYHYSTGDDVDRLLVVGERLEALNFADGATLWQTKDDVGSPAGRSGKFLFFVNDEKLNAFELGGSGTPVWSTPVHASEANVLLKNPADSEDTSPLGPDDLLAYTGSTVYRLDLATGAVRWTLPVGDGDLYLRDGLVFIASADKVTAHDFAGAAPKWDLKVGKSVVPWAGAPSGVASVELFVDRGDYKKDKDQYVCPCRFWGVELASGKVVWSLPDLDGSKIVRWGVMPGERLRVHGEKGGKCKTLTMADGAAATAPAPQYDVGTNYSDEKGLRGQNWACAVVWERKGEGGSYTFWKSGVVIWTPKSGPVEVIRLADGETLWKEDLGGDLRVNRDDSEHNIVLRHGDKVTLLHVTP
jgi:putative pyrroloquinoline-quinone binding quinoprotein